MKHLDEIGKQIFQIGMSLQLIDLTDDMLCMIQGWVSLPKFLWRDCLKTLWSLTKLECKFSLSSHYCIFINIKINFSFSAVGAVAVCEFLYVCGGFDGTQITTYILKYQSHEWKIIYNSPFKIYFRNIFSWHRWTIWSWFGRMEEYCKDEQKQICCWCCPSRWKNIRTWWSQWPFYLWVCGILWYKDRRMGR